jgi:N-acetylmuramoyl-L-alanine amidase
MIILERLLDKGVPNRPGRPMAPLYITIHETGNTAKGAGAEAHSKYISSEAARVKKVSWHYTVDDKMIIRHIPENETAFHAGDGQGPGNTRSIGIEICINSDGDFEAAKRNARLLIADILLRKRGLEIVQHNRWNNKDCPKTLRKSGWDGFVRGAREDYLALVAERLRERGVINSPGYWINAMAGRADIKREYVEELLANIAGA